MDNIQESIERAVDRLDERSSVTDSIRMKVVNKLAAVVSDMVLDPDVDKASVTEAKMSTANSLLKALNDVDSQHRDNIKLKQRTKADADEKDNAKLISQTVTEFLKTIKEIEPSKDIAASKADTEDILTKATDEKAFDILEDELAFNEKTAKDIET